MREWWRTMSLPRRVFVLFELTVIAILVAMIANFSSIDDKVFVAVVLAIGVSNFVGPVVFGQIEKRRELNEIVRRVREEEARRWEDSGMAVEVVPYSVGWPAAFDSVESILSAALADLPVVSIEHVGSTAVPGLAAKPIIDIDIVVERKDVSPAIRVLSAIGYLHLGDLGLVDREAFEAPEAGPRRNVYLCVAGTLHVRNHLAVRDILRTRADLRDRYGAVKLALALDPTTDIPRYLDGKSEVLQEILAHSDLTNREEAEVLRTNSLDR